MGSEKVRRSESSRVCVCVGGCYTEGCAGETGQRKKGPDIGSKVEECEESLVRRSRRGQPTYEEGPTELKHPHCVVPVEGSGVSRVLKHGGCSTW